jgi:hypothetical protein
VINATFNNISVISWWGQFYWWRKSEYPEKITDLPQATGQTLSHNVVDDSSDHVLSFQYLRVGRLVVDWLAENMTLT